MTVLRLGQYGRPSLATAGLLVCDPELIEVSASPIWSWNRCAAIQLVSWSYSYLCRHMRLCVRTGAQTCGYAKSQTKVRIGYLIVKHDSMCLQSAVKYVKIGVLKVL